MASARKTFFATTAIAVVGVSGYFLYSAFAVQGQGTLAQAPLNIQTTVPPAFIMGVDNSGSMSSDETLCRTGQGQCAWNATTRSFFDSDGVALESGDNSYMKVMDEGAPRPDIYGAARDPEFNRSYFNPHTLYLPWQKYNGEFEEPSPTTAALEDVRYPKSGTTYDFTTYRQSTFTYRNGMVMPTGTTYFNDRSCNREPGSSETKDAWVTLAEDKTFTENCSTTFRYYPAVVYLTTTAPPPPGFKVGPLPDEPDMRILVKGAGPKGTDLYKYEYLESNFKTGGAEAVQNFANWWTYYGNRNRAMIAAMTQSLVDITNMRVGYFQINPAPPTGNVTMYDMAATETDKKDLYVRMRALDSSGNTPTRRAVAYMVQQFKRADKDAPIQLVCQKNAGMLFTDGYTNDTSTPSPTVGDVDGALPAPFGGGVASSNTIADYAMDGYINNLRPTGMKAGQVPYPKAACDVATPDPRLDCQSNLHMNFYGITLGARGRVYDVDAAATKDPYANPPAWGATGTMNLDPRNVDDIWHAAINSRGEFINATSPTAVTAAMRRILQQVGAGATPSGSIALTGARIGEGSLTVVPFYESTNNGIDWYSTLTGATVTNKVDTGEVVFKDIWEASKKLPAPAERMLTTWFARTTGGVVPTVQQFAAANLGAEPYETLCSNALFARCSKTKITALGASQSQVVDYLLGDQTYEAKNAGAIKLRDRTTPLGDIVNSSPVVVTPSMDDYGYTSLRGTTATDYDPYNYANYLKTTKKSRKSMVYVGANDGMLHAFDGTTGIERFAYIPATALGHMGNLLFPYKIEDKNDQVFSHRYYVDGPVTVSDAHIGGGWETVLVGTAGAGGRSVFGLNVSDPTGFEAADVLWEVNDQVSDANVKNNIGYVLGKPVIVPVKIGTTVRWKAIFGNGYDSVNGVAALFVVDMASGAVEYAQAIEAAAPVNSNGLGNIIVVDRWLGSTTTAGRDGYADTVYGGDQNGAVWKFDLRTAKPTVGVGGEPLFVAMDASGDRQPITGGFEAASGPSGGVMLYFGSGSFSFLNDGSDETMQSLYAVLDNFSDKPITGRTQLLEQRLLLDGAGIRSTTRNTGLGKFGWYMDLGVSGVSGPALASGERFVGNPVIASGVVFFPTYDPSSTADCGTTGNNWLYGLDALTGGAALNGVKIGSPNGTSYGEGTGAVQLDTKGTAPVKDVAVMATPKQGILPLSGDLDAALKAQCSMVVQTAGAAPLYLPRPCGRQSWRQVL